MTAAAAWRGVFIERLKVTGWSSRTRLCGGIVLLGAPTGAGRVVADLGVPTFPPSGSG